MSSSWDPAWGRLREDYRQYGIALSFGAGISAASEVPTWRAVLQRLLEEVLREEEQRELTADQAGMVDGLVEMGFSYPAVASLVENRVGREEFLKLVRRILYERVEERFPGISRAHEDALQSFCRWVNQDNPTLAALAAFCVSRTENRWIPNPRVSAIVNFNLDGIFRLYASAMYEGPIFQTIERANRTVPLGLVRYYHPHGYLPVLTSDRNAEDLVVFTEEDFFDFFDRPTGLFTYTLLGLLREQPMLFAGLSFSDENLRRLLYYSNRERCEHHERDAETNSDPEPRHYAIFRSQGEVLDGLLEDSLERLGVQPLWVSQYEDLMQRLGAVYGEGWDDLLQSR